MRARPRGGPASTRLLPRSRGQLFTVLSQGRSPRSQHPAGCGPSTPPLGTPMRGSGGQDPVWPLLLAAPHLCPGKQAGHSSRAPVSPRGARAAAPKLSRVPTPRRMPPKPLGHRRPWLPPAPSPAPCLSAVTRTSNPHSVPHPSAVAPTPQQDPRTSLPRLALEVPAGHPENREDALAHRPGPANLPPAEGWLHALGRRLPRLFGVGGILPLALLGP